jgi:hypothetical protein
MAEVDFKKLTEEKYNELRKLLKENSSPEALENFVEKNFDVAYVASNACRHKLSDGQVNKLRDPVKKFSRFLFKGEAIQKVIDSTMNVKKMLVTTKKTMTFVNSELSDGTKFTTIFRANGVLIDIRCVGISLIRILDTIIEKYCTTQKTNFRSKSVDERIDIIVKAIEWHINGQQ